jgi:hypothetical protein
LRQARMERVCPFSETDVIELVEAGLIRIGVRPENILLDPGKRVFYRRGNSALDDFVMRQFETGSGYIVVHPHYDSSRIAFEEIERRESPDVRSHYYVAREYVERHLHGDNCVPPIVEERARFFGDVDFDEIHEPYIKECMKLIRLDKSLDSRERAVLLICSQLIRLSIEHDRLMARHGCDIHFSQENYAAVFRDVVGTIPEKQSLGWPLPDTLDQIFELIEYLLEANPIQNGSDFRSRHAKLAQYRDAIWDLACRSSDIDGYLLSRIGDIKPVFAYAFGSDAVSKFLSGTSATLALSAVVSALLDDLALGASGSLGLAIARATWNMLNAERRRLGSDAIWAGVLVYDVSKPSRDQMGAVAWDLKRRISARRVI